MRNYYLLSDYVITQYMVALVNFTTNYLVATGRWEVYKPTVKPHIIFLEGVRNELIESAQILEFRRG